MSTVPHAVPYAPALAADDRAVLESDTQSRHGDTIVLAGAVEIRYRGRTLRADTVTYNQATGDATADGHLHLTGDENDESIEASHGEMNLRTGTGRFYDVKGSVGMRNGAGILQPTGAAANGQPTAFLFQGRMVVKSGPTHYDVYDGSVTSCQMPRPDWLLSSRHIWLDGRKAHAKSSTFRLLNVPIFFLPYVTAPTDEAARQSGLLIPVISQSSTKGFVIGEQIYLVLGRSADLTAGFEYFSSRGFSESGTFRYRGRDLDFASVHFSALQDRGYVDKNSGVLINQGGQDISASFRRDFTQKTRGVGDAEYLSSYVYREAFNNNFNQAVSSDITSLAYLSHTTNGFVMDGRFERYQGLKRVPYTNAQGQSFSGQEVRIFHAPTFEFNGVDHHIFHTPFVWTVNSSFGGLKRVQPNFSTRGVMPRFDLRGELALPFHFDGWNGAASVALRETHYSKSRQTPYTAAATPVEVNQALDRTSLEMKLDLRPPAVERTFTVPERWQKMLGTEVRHTVEPELTYRNVRGIDNFLSVLRFDDVDLMSNTDELEYGVTQHLYFRPPTKKAKVQPGCELEPEETAAAKRDEAARDAFLPSSASSNDANGIATADASAPDLPLRGHAKGHRACAPQTPQQQEWFSWKLAQKHFFDPTFGGAVLNSRRNIFDTTLNLSGIAYLTEARDTSPLVSRMRFRTSSHTDVEWDFDLDTGAKRFTSSNVFLDVHEGQWFGGLSYANLNAPGRFYKEVINTTNNTTTLQASATSNFQQARFLLGYGAPTKPGLSAAANAGLDFGNGSLQYGSLQTSYNWNCCGASVEYRKYELGSTRNEGVFRFSFTLINIGTAGNLRRTERLF